MKTAMILAVALALFGGCGIDEPPLHGAHLQLNPEFDLMLKAEQMAACVNIAAGVEVITLGNSVGSVPVAYGPLTQKSFCGEYRYEENTIGIRRDQKCPPVLILVHEAGHAMGLSHSLDPTSVMFHALDVSMPTKRACESLVSELARD